MRSSSHHSSKWYAIACGGGGMKLATLKTSRPDGELVVVMLSEVTVVKLQGHVVGLDLIHVGSTVKIKALLNGGEHVAIVVELEGLSDFTELKGTIAAIGTDSITIVTESGNEVTIAVDEDTMIQFGGHREVLLSELAAGDVVRVYAVAAENGQHEQPVPRVGAALERADPLAEVGELLGDELGPVALAADHDRVVEGPGGLVLELLHHAVDGDVAAPHRAWSLHRGGGELVDVAHVEDLAHPARGQVVEQLQGSDGVGHGSSRTSRQGLVTCAWTNVVS